MTTPSSGGRLGVRSATAARVTHGRTRHGKQDYIYTLWVNISQRTKRPKYAALPVPVYPAWQKSHEAFRSYILTHCGQRPDGHTLERINGAKGYIPGNLKWETREEQNRHRDNVNRYHLTPDSKGYTLQEWADYFQKLTGTRWTRRKLESLLKHLTLEQIFTGVHPERKTPRELAEAAFRREQHDAEEALRQIVPDGLAPFDDANLDADTNEDEGADGYGEVFE